MNFVDDNMLLKCKRVKNIPIQSSFTNEPIPKIVFLGTMRLYPSPECQRAVRREFQMDEFKEHVAGGNRAELELSLDPQIGAISIY